MARFSTLSGTDDLIRQLGRLSSGSLQKKMVEESAPILVESLKSSANRYRDTGDMADSIKASPVRKTSDGHICDVCPTGTGRNKTRNMEKMAYHEYGTYKQTAKPIVKPAVNNAEPGVVRKMQEVYEEGVK